MNDLANVRGGVHGHTRRSRQSAEAYRLQLPLVGASGNTRAGKHFTAEEADLLTTEGQNRATAVAGQIWQVAAQLGIKLEN